MMSNHHIYIYTPGITVIYGNGLEELSSNPEQGSLTLNLC